MKILFKYPSRSRPQKFFQGLDNIAALCKSYQYDVLATLDEDDPSMNNGYVKEHLKQYPEVRTIYGLSKNKIHACNRDMENAPYFDILILMSDDMVFLKDGFDKIIVDNMKKYFPDTDGMLHMPDSHGKWELSVLSIMGRKYYQRFNYIYHPSYESLWADNEYTEVARILNSWRFVPIRIYDHFHHIWGLSEPDALNVRNDRTELYVKDNQTYINRKAINFGINIFQ